MYDQFALHPDVQAYYAFKLHSGESVALNRSPMGFKFSHGIAQTSSETLGYDPPSPDEQMKETNIIHLDNFGFSWSRTKAPNEQEERKQIVQKMTRFFTRVAAAKFQLNEFTQDEIHSFLQENDDNKWKILEPHIFHKTRAEKFTFLGVKYEMKQSGNTKEISDKTINKLTAVTEILARDSILPQASYRQIAMLVGIIRYCSKILELNNEDFDAYDTTREMAHACTIDINTWDKQIGPRTATLLQPLVAISRKILTAKPRRVSIPFDIDTAVKIFVDASKIGWGGIAMFPTGEKRIVKARWQQPALWESSVKAEPKAVEEIFDALKLPKNTHVIIATDHEGLVWASQAVQIHTYTYHKAVRRTQEQGIRAIYTFIQGAVNPADEPSRDKPSTATDRELTVLGAAAGAGVAFALQFPSNRRIPDLLVRTVL